MPAFLFIGRNYLTIKTHLCGTVLSTANLNLLYSLYLARRKLYLYLKLNMFLDFSQQLLSETSLNLRRIQQGTVTDVLAVM